MKYFLRTWQNQRRNAVFVDVEHIPFLEYHFHPAMDWTSAPSKHINSWYACCSTRVVYTRECLLNNIYEYIFTFAEQLCSDINKSLILIELPAYYDWLLFNVIKSSYIGAIYNIHQQMSNYFIRKIINLII